MSGIVKPLPGAQLNLDHPLSAGLVGCWLLNENSGNRVHDYSGQNNEGTLSGFNDPPIATSGWNAGPHGGALAFPGASALINCGTGLGTFLGNGITNISIGIWFRALAVTDSRLFTIGNLGIGNHGAISFYLNASFLRYRLNNNDIDNGFAFIDTASWHLLVFTSDRVDVKMYLDGPEKTSHVYSTGFNLSGLPTIIGTFYTTGGSNFDGLFSSVSIYNRALSADEIAYLYAFPYCMFDLPPIWQMFDPYRAQRAMNHHRQMRAA